MITIVLKWSRSQFSLKAAAIPTRCLVEIRSLAEISLHIKILPTKERPLYQKISQKVKQLRKIGMSYTDLASHVRVDIKTVITVYNFNAT